MAKIVHVLKSLDMGGTTKTAQLFCEYLATHTDHEVVLLYKEDGDISRLPLFLQHIPCFPFKDEQGCNYRLAALKPDIVHVYRSGFPDWPHPSPQYKFVETNVFGMHDTNIHLTKTLYMSKWLHDKSKRRLSIISRGIGNWATRFDYVNNPVKPHASDKAMDLGLSDDTIVLGHISRPDPGLFDGLSTDACKILIERGYNNIHYLVFAPPSNLREALVKHQIPHTIIEPTIDEETLSRYYHTVDIMLHDRVDGESAGNVTYEQQFAGKPIVTAISIPKYPGMGCFNNQLWSIQNGVNGLHATRDPVDYANKIELLINSEDLRIQFGDAARAWAHEHYHWMKSGKKLVSIYEELLDQK